VEEVLLGLVKLDGDRLVRDLGVDEFKALIYEAVEEKLEEMLGDPDQGLELKERLKARLKRSLSTRSQSIPVEKVAKDLGLDW
jgi:hypothetical protein